MVASTTDEAVATATSAVEKAMVSGVFTADEAMAMVLSAADEAMTKDTSTMNKAVANGVFTADETVASRSLLPGPHVCALGTMASEWLFEESDTQHRPPCSPWDMGHETVFACVSFLHMHARMHPSKDVIDSCSARSTRVLSLRDSAALQVGLCPRGLSQRGLPALRRHRRHGRRVLRPQRSAELDD